MPCVLVLLTLMIVAAAGGEAPAPEVPPSPSSVSGERTWPDPRFTHWPAIMYEDERRNLSFELPVRRAGVAGSIGWVGGDALPFVLDAEGDRISGLIPAPRAFGEHRATVKIAERSWDLVVRVVDARQPWPLARLVDGFPVDDEGRPVLLVDRRRDPAVARRWEILAADLPRPSGRALLVGDPLEAYGESTWTDLDADARIAIDERYPQHAVLVALANLPTPLPRTVVWSPGNQALFGAEWSAEEERLLAAIRTRFESAQVMPRLVLVLPPTPVDDELHEQAAERCELLARSATFLKWKVLDVDAIAGPPDQADRIADGVFTRYPLGAAQRRVREAIARSLRD